MLLVSPPALQVLMKELIRLGDIQVTSSSSFEQFDAALQQADASTRPGDKDEDEGQIPDAKEEEEQAKWESKLDKVEAEARCVCGWDLFGRV